MSIPSSRAVVATTPSKLTAEKLLLYLAPLLGKIARTIRLDFLSQGRADFSQFAAGVVIDNLGKLAGANKGQGADILAHQLGEEVGRFTVGTAPDAFSLIYKWRIPEDKILSPVRRAVIIHHAKGQTHQLFRHAPRG